MKFGNAAWNKKERDAALTADDVNIDGAKKLFIAIVSDAIKCASDSSDAGARDKAMAVSWFKSDDFSGLCYVAGLSAPLVLGAISDRCGV